MFLYQRFSYLILKVIEFECFSHNSCWNLAGTTPAQSRADQVDNKDESEAHERTNFCNKSPRSLLRPVGFTCTCNYAIISFLVLPYALKNILQMHVLLRSGAAFDPQAGCAPPFPRRLPMCAHVCMTVKKTKKRPPALLPGRSFLYLALAPLLLPRHALTHV